jgi:hypothetical protein
MADEQVELEWQAPPECPQRAAVQQKLRSLAGEAWRTTERVSAKGRIERVDKRYRLTLSVRDGATVKERTIDSDSCIDLGGAAAVTLGLLLGRSPNSGEGDPARAAGTGTSADGTADGRASETTTPGGANDRSSTTGAAAATKATAASPKPQSPKSPTADDSRAESSDASEGTSTRTWRVLVRAPLLTLDFVRLPKPSVGIGAGLGVRLAEWRLLAIGRILHDQTQWADQYPAQYPDVGIRVSRATAETWVCRGFRDASLELAPCLTVGLDHLTIRGQGPPNIARQTQKSLAALIGGSASFHVYLAEWIAIFASAGIAVATSSPTLTIQNLGEVGHVGPVQVSAGIGSEWIF